MGAKLVTVLDDKAVKAKIGEMLQDLGKGDEYCIKEQKTPDVLKFAKDDNGDSQTNNLFEKDPEGNQGYNLGQ